MNAHRGTTTSIRIALTLLVLALLGTPALAERKLFAMDTGTRDGQTKTYAQQAKLVKDLGYSGIGYSGCSRIAEMLAAVDGEGIEFSPVYTGIQVKPGEITHDPNLESAITQLAGRDAIIWLYVGGKRPGEPARTDGPLVEKLRSLADHAAKSKVRIALYPHAGAYADRIEDCVRLASAVDRKNLGVTFNLCHWLKVDGTNLEERLKDALPHLFVVTVNGANVGGKGWSTLIQPLDRGSFDVARVLRLLDKMEFKGLIGLQHYGVGGPAREKLARSMEGWRTLQSRLAAKPVQLMPDGKLDAFKKAGAWTGLSEVRIDPDNPKKLIGKPGGGELLNGPSGRTGHLVSAQSFGDVEAHIEFMISQKSNSGAYFMGRYEIQIYDSHGVEKDKYPGLECGGIYPRWIDNKNVEGHTPQVNVSRPAGEWQTFHVLFRAPRFDAAGKKTAKARFEKVWHNGSLIHENLDLEGPTRGATFGDEKATGPLMLQGDHGPIAFRNVWIAELTE
ncbi:MAG: family 16 glycoside hydrolase [Akkermansiaceae bacterium]